MIYVTGDCHGDFSRFKDDVFQNLTKDDYIIIVGDFGGIWSDKGNLKYEKKNIKELQKMKFTTLFIDGNHENFNRLNKFPIINWHGGKVHRINSSIFHLMRGEIYQVNDKKIFVFGGAQSHDIKDGILNICEKYRIEEYEEKGLQFRIRDYNWWDLELPTEEQYKNGLLNLKKYNYEIDYIFTHCAPTSIQRNITGNYPVNQLTNYLEDIKEKVIFKKWFFGHYHRNENFEQGFVCLYDSIIKLK